MTVLRLLSEEEFIDSVIDHLLEDPEEEEGGE